MNPRASENGREPVRPGWMALLDIVRDAGLVAPGPDVSPQLEPASAKEYHFDPQRTVEMFAQQLKRLHALDTQQVVAPVLTMGEVVESARTATEAEPDAPVDAAYAHMSRPVLLEVLDAGLGQLEEPDDSGLVITHGSPRLGVMLCDEGTAVGLAHWEAMAVADRHRDLARVAASLVTDMGPMILPVFFDSYGMHPNPVRLDWWLLAAQLLPPSGRTN